MAGHRRQLKRKKPRQLSSVSQSETQFFSNKINKENGKSMKNSHPYNHPYATRSKTFENFVSLTIGDGRKKASRKLSENSVIFIGAFRKIPPLIDLENHTSQNSYYELYEKIDIQSCFKMEPVRIFFHYKL